MQLARVTIGEKTSVVAKDGGAIRDVTAFFASDDFVQTLASLSVNETLAPNLASYPEVQPDVLTWLTPSARPQRILCLGFNYRAHAAESGRAVEPPQFPTFFVRFPSSLVAHGELIEAQSASDSLDWEGEIAVIIGTAGRDIPRERALDHVAGYTAFGDDSIRHFQDHSSQSTAGKNFDRTGSYGPWVITADEVPRPEALEVKTFVNNQQVQHGRLSDLFFDIPAIIEYVSSWTTLSPGDVIATGTPSGIGYREDPPRSLHPGDVLRIDIVDHMSLTNEVGFHAAPHTKDDNK